MTLPAILPPLGLDGITLKHGGHATREDGVCLLEAVAWLAGEPHSDKPACACPIMSAIGRRLNDRIKGDDERTALLRPLVTLLAGSKSTRAVELRRMYMAVDWSIREIVPQWMDLRPNLASHAAALRALAIVADKATAEGAVVVARKARDAARIERAVDAYAADASADAYAYAAYAASADAYAAAYAYAAADAVDAYAYAYAAAADAYANKSKIEALVKAQRASTVELLRRMAAVTE